MNGYDLAKALRSQSENMDALFIALTGHGSAHERMLSRMAGFHHHFVKPMDGEKLQLLFDLARM